jgi:hypothetical protein
VGSLYILYVAAAFWPNEIFNSFQAQYVYVNFIIILHVEDSQWNSEHYSASLRTATKRASKTSVAAVPAVFSDFGNRREVQCAVSVAKRGTDCCSKLRALSLPTGNRDWYYIHTIHYCY